MQKLLPNIVAKLRNVSVKNFVTGKPKSCAAILSFTPNNHVLKSIGLYYPRMRPVFLETNS